MIENLKIACPVCSTMRDVPIDLDAHEFIDRVSCNEMAAVHGLLAIQERLARECQYIATCRHEGRPF